jgi:hypothetical protein
MDAFDASSAATYSLPFTSNIDTSNEARALTLSFEVQYFTHAVCPQEEGPYSIHTSTDQTYEYLFQTRDPIAELTEIHYCQHKDDLSSAPTDAIRGWSATFANSDASTSEVFTYA